MLSLFWPTRRASFAKRAAGRGGADGRCCVADGSHFRRYRFCYDVGLLANSSLCSEPGGCHARRVDPVCCDHTGELSGNPHCKDLMGGVIGLQRPRDAYEKNARSALQHLKLNPDKDVKFLYLGTNEAMWIALEGSRVVATMVSPLATLFARKAGMSFLVKLSDLKIEYQGSTFATRRSLMKNYPNLTLRAVRAMVRGIHFFKTRREDTYKILAKFLGTSDPEALEESWHYGADMPAKPFAVESAVQSVINHLAEGDSKFAKTKPSDFIESGPLTELDRSGYIDRLYGGRDTKAK